MSSYTCAKSHHGRVWHIVDRDAALALCGQLETDNWRQNDNPSDRADFCKKCKEELWQGTLHHDQLHPRGLCEECRRWLDEMKA
jgi:hypothetical protein